MDIVRYSIGDIVRFKKKHPCGGFDWEVMRVGADFRIKCLECGRVLMLPRSKFEKAVKARIKAAASSVPCLTS